MSEYANMYIALTVEHVDEDYITRALTELKIPKLKVPTPETEAEVYTIGQGENILIISGFSLYDYKIVNALTLYISSQYSSIRTLRALPAKLFTEKRLLIYPITNKYSYNRYIVKTRNYKRSIVDEDGIEVLRDLLTLRSRYTKTLHSLIKNIRPHILITVTTDKTLGIELDEPAINMVKNKHSKIEISIPITREIDNLKDVLQLPHTHHTYENDVSLGLLLAIPFNYSVQDTYTVILKIIEQTLKAKIEKRTLKNIEETSKIKVLSGKDEILSTLKQHDIEIIDDSGNEITVKYYKNNELHTKLIEEGEIEYYFNVEILS
ncbi:MAG: hypothetical protein GXO26_00605 [Crenarchaeota archaeon]|nr:hypothetical protein [Thermoproteota archaeon]